MVKKMIKSIVAVLAAVFVLFLTLSPVLVSKAEAMVIRPGIDSDGNLSAADVYYLMAPLDRMHNGIYDISCENPMYSVAVKNGFNEVTNIEMPYIGDAGYLGTPLGRWSFGVQSIESSDSGSYMVHFANQFDASSNSALYSLSNSSPFVANAVDLYNFLAKCKHVVQPMYEYKSKFVISGLYPCLVSERGWELVPFTCSQDFEYLNQTENVRTVSAFAELDFSLLPIDLRSTVNSKLCIITDFTVTFDLYAQLGPGVLSATFQDLMMPVSAEGFGHTFEEFYAEYPGNRVIVSDTPGAGIFDLTEGLKTAVGGFMGTEIIPGLSFGTILAFAIGISLVYVFLKFFGG